MAETIRLDDPDLTVTVRRSARARRLTLTVPQNGDPPRVTAPPRIPVREIRMFLLRQGDWLARAVARLPEQTIVTDGALIPVAGVMLRITHSAGPRRAPQIDGDRLLLQGGDAAAIGKRTEVWLKERARADVTAIAHSCARALGAQVGTIKMRDTKGQWGSCTHKGDMSFSWRLAMAPPKVLDYVAAHEAAHLLEMNHGPDFWAHVGRLRPEWRTQRTWLKTHGNALHRYRFAS
ncbi:MAG: M48 family metallopeptidase [Pikeienuella sp.]